MSDRRWAPAILLESANVISGIANAIVMITIPWLILEITNSALAAGVVAGVSSVLGGVAAIGFGVLIDRIGRRVMSIASDVLSAVSVAAIPIVALFTDLNFAWILILAAIGAVFDPSGYSARKTLIIDVAKASRIDIAKLNGIHEGLFAVGWTVGPVIAAFLIATLGAVTSFWIPTALFIAAAILIWFLRVTEGQSESVEPSIGGSEVIKGLAIVWRDRPLRALTIAVMILAAVYLPTEAVVLPFYFEQLQQPERLGLLIAVLAGGGVIGSFGYGWIAARMRRYTLARVVLIGTIVSIVPLAFLPAYPIMLVAAFVLGLSWGPMTPLMNTVVQRRVAADAQGRVFGVQLAAFYAAPPLSMIIVGALVGVAGVSATYLALAAVLAVTGVVVFFVPSIRQIND